MGALELGKDLGQAWSAFQFLHLYLMKIVWNCWEELHLPQALYLNVYVIEADNDVLLVKVVGQGGLFADVGAGVHSPPGQFVQEVVTTDRLQAATVAYVHLSALLAAAGEVHPGPQTLRYRHQGSTKQKSQYAKC